MGEVFVEVLARGHFLNAVVLGRKGDLPDTVCHQSQGFCCSFCKDVADLLAYPKRLAIDDVWGASDQFVFRGGLHYLCGASDGCSLLYSSRQDLRLER